jgi:hypothetical protein
MASLSLWILPTLAVNTVSIRDWITSPKPVASMFRLFSFYWFPWASTRRLLPNEVAPQADPQNAYNNFAVKAWRLGASVDRAWP